MRPDGTYGPAADPNLVQAYVASLSKQVGSRAVEPSVVYTSGTPSALKGGRDGTGFDVPTDSQTIEAYLAQLSLGANPTAVLAMATAPVSPQITLDSLTGMTIIGSWTTTFYPDISNGMGANIRIPATLLNGQVVAPGQQFSFLRAVSPIDTAHGFTLGGVIVHGKSDHTGAIGGGICSASTTMFNAAARAGLQIDERHAHSYYINRYPVGLDATVYSNGYSAMDLKWTNDTANPILIRGRTTKGSKSTITIELWSLPLNRTVTFSPQYKSNVQKATDHTVYTTALKVGQQNRAEYPTDGFDTSRTRTVTDSTGKVLHTDTWTSHYIRVDGLLEIGHKATPTPPPSKSPAAPGAGLSIVTAEPPRSPLRLS
jgi:vancomycin resistance protein YoaR